MGFCGGPGSSLRPQDGETNRRPRALQSPTIDTTSFMAHIMAMKVANIAELKDNLSRFLSAVEEGEEVEVRRHNVPIARLVPIAGRRPNRTVLGCGAGSAKTTGDLTEPLIPEEDWEMHR